MRRSFLIDDDSTFRPAAGGAFLCRYLDRRGATDLCACRLPNVSQVLGLALSGPTVVKHLQLMLNERGGHPVLVEDSVFGSTTETSVKHYQQNENLTVDGIVGKQTWTSLLSKWLLQSEPG